MRKVLLLISLLTMAVGLAFNTGLFGAHDIDALYTVFPTGASFFGLFLIVMVMEKESEGYDREQQKPQVAVVKSTAK